MQQRKGAGQKFIIVVCTIVGETLTCGIQIIFDNNESITVCSKQQLKKIKRIAKHQGSFVRDVIGP